MSNEIVKQLNAEINQKLVKWKRTAILITDDEAQIEKEFCKKLPNESEHAFKLRKQYFICQFINIANELINAQVAAVFRQGVRIEPPKPEDEKKGVESKMQPFVDNVSNSEDNIISLKTYLLDFIAPGIKAYGTTFCLIDKAHVETDNREVELAEGKPYLFLLSPFDVRTWCMQGNELQWFSYSSRELRNSEASCDDPVGNTKQEGEIDVIHVLTKDTHHRLEGGGGVLIDSVTHGYGFVPVVIKGMYKLTSTSVLGNSSMDQTSKMIISANNNLHLANYEVMKNGNSTLLMPEESRTGKNRGIDLEGNTEIKKQDNDTVLEYAGEIAPGFLVKDLATEEQMKLAEFYFRAATDNEKNQKSVAKKGSDGQAVQESGFAKMVELQPVENNLIALATALEDNARQILDMAAAIIDIDNDMRIEFNKKYDLRTIKQMYEDMTLAVTNDIKKVSVTAYKTMHKQIANKQFTDPETNKEVIAEIDVYVPMDDDEDLDKIEKDLNNFEK